MSKNLSSNMEIHYLLMEIKLSFEVETRREWDISAKLSLFFFFRSFLSMDYIRSVHNHFKLNID
jgi:hypothetical protein